MTAPSPCLISAVLPDGVTYFHDNTNGAGPNAVHGPWVAQELSFIFPTHAAASAILVSATFPDSAQIVDPTPAMLTNAAGAFLAADGTFGTRAKATTFPSYQAAYAVIPAGSGASIADAAPAAKP